MFLEKELARKIVATGLVKYRRKKLDNMEAIMNVIDDIGCTLMSSKDKLRLQDYVALGEALTIASSLGRSLALLREIVSLKKEMKREAKERESILLRMEKDEEEEDDDDDRWDNWVKLWSE